MYDIYLDWGMDICVSSSGDIALIDGSKKTNQRVLRRLLTNSGDYLWNLGYGGGLAAFVGSSAFATDIEAVIRTQISLEPSVPGTPAPDVVIQTVNANKGEFTAQILYADPDASSLVNLNVSIG